MGQLEMTTNAGIIEKILFGLKIFVMGFGTVFVVLLVLWLLLYIFQLGFDKTLKKQTKAPVTDTKISVSNNADDVNDDTELVAVLMAAICAANGKKPDNIKIVSFKRKKTPWNRI